VELSRSSDQPARSSNRSKSEPKTPRKTEEISSKRSEGNPPMQAPQIAAESLKSRVPAVTDVPAVKSESDVQGVSNGPQSAGNVSERAQRVVPSSTASMSQAVIPPSQPLFDEQQLRQFQETFNQAPWLYPGAQQLMIPQLAMPPPIARPLFLEQDERRVQGSLQVGEAPQFVYPYAQNPGPQENLGLKRDLEMLMEENKKLRECVLAWKSQKEEEPRFPHLMVNKRRLRPPQERPLDPQSMKLKSPKDSASKEPQRLKQRRPEISEVRRLRPPKRPPAPKSLLGNHMHKHCTVTLGPTKLPVSVCWDHIALNGVLLQKLSKHVTIGFGRGQTSCFWGPIRARSWKMLQ